MGESVLVDNDIALKIACYTLCTEMLAVATVNGYPPSLLGVARFVIRQRLNRAVNIANKQAASAAFEHLLRSVRAIEPIEAELMMAADLQILNHRDRQRFGLFARAMYAATLQLPRFLPLVPVHQRLPFRVWLHVH
jgi:hypothetical protein